MDNTINVELSVKSIKRIEPEGSCYDSKLSMRLQLEGVLETDLIDLVIQRNSLFQVKLISEIKGMVGLDEILRCFDIELIKKFVEDNYPEYS